MDVRLDDSLRKCQYLGDVHGHAYLVDLQIGIRRNHRARRKIHAFSGEVSPESSVFALQTLHQAPSGFLGLQISFISTFVRKLMEYNYSYHHCKGNPGQFTVNI